MRPTRLDEFVGQRHFLGEGKLLRRLLKADRLGSVIFYGPPGTGKTTLASLLATETRSRFRQISAVTSGVKELRTILTEARDELAAGGQKTVLFVDEIHHFNKSQQDALAAGCGRRHRDADRRHDGESVLRGEQCAGQPQPDLPVRAAVARTTSRRCCAGRWRTRSADWASRTCGCTTTPLEFLAEVCDGDARRALGGAGDRRALQRRAAAGVHAGLGRGVGAAQGRVCTTPTATRTTTRPAR